MMNWAKDHKKVMPSATEPIPLEGLTFYQVKEGVLFRGDIIKTDAKSRRGLVEWEDGQRDEMSYNMMIQQVFTNYPVTVDLPPRKKRSMDILQSRDVTSTFGDDFSQEG